MVLLTFPLAGLPVALGLGAPLWLAIAAALVGGIAVDILSVIWDTTLQREIPEEALSRVSAYDALGSLMFGPIGLLLAGPAVVALGPEPVLLTGAAVTVLVSLAALCSPGVRGRGLRRVGGAGRGRVVRRTGGGGAGRGVAAGPARPSGSPADCRPGP